MRFSVNKKTRNILLVCCGAAAGILAAAFLVLLIVFGPPEAAEPTLSYTEPTPTAPVTDAPTDAPTDPPPTEKRYTLSFAGDCTLGTHTTMMYYNKNFINLVGTNYDYPFQNVQHLFATDDCTFVNLESVFADSGTPADKKFTFRAPVHVAQVLTYGSVEAVSIANNHSYDFGEAGYQSTKATLDNLGVHYAEQRSTTVFTTESGLTIGFYALYACNINPQIDEMKAAVEQMLDQGAEIIVASVHWGEENWYSTTAKQRRIAHDLIDAGVDIVWGHHPHVLQKIEEYKDGYIYYSLGNFSFGGNHNPGDKDSAVLQMEIIRSPEGKISLGELTIVPCRLSRTTSYNDFVPTPYAEGSADYSRTMSKLQGTYTKPTPAPTTPPTQAPTEPPTEPPTEAPTEPEVTEPETEPEVTEPETEPETEPVTEPVTEPETEPPTEGETLPEG